VSDPNYPGSPEPDIPSAPEPSFPDAPEPSPSSAPASHELADDGTAAANDQLQEGGTER
jgi:hypothetical protein